MRFRGVLLVWTAPADVSADNDQRRPLGDALRVRDRRIDRVEIVAVGDVLDMPAVGFEALRRVVREGEVGGPVDSDAIVVVESDQLAELQVTGERGGFVRDALHQVAVGRQKVRVVIDDRVPRPVEQRRQLRLGDRHADGVARALPERSCRCFDARRDAVLGVARRAAAPLPELLDVLEREVVAGQIQHAVQQHARVTSGKNEAVAVQPIRIRRVVTQMALPQDVRERRERHGGAGVSRIGLLHRVHRQRTDGVDAELIQRFAHTRDGLGHNSPDLAACQSFVRRSKPSTSISTCCGDGEACAAILSSSTSLGISFRPCFALSVPI